MSNTLTRTTKHTHPVVFGRREADCPRCDELNAGAEPIRWHRSRFNPQPMGSPRDFYCFCPTTSLAADRCPSCGKPPYTD
jgi:hypothetical protein